MAFSDNEKSAQPSSSTLVTASDTRTSREKVDDNQESSHTPTESAHQDGKDGYLHNVATATSAAAPPYSVYTSSQKMFIVIMASWAALFSPLSANIYYPALDILTVDLNVSSSQINLTITTYLIFQGLAPSFVGTFSDERGRRPAYLICFTLYIAACIGLALQDSYAALMVLRCLQSTGSSGTVALASAVVADVVTSAERGTYVGYANMGALIGPALGPVIGGLLCQFLSWRATFWFLVIFGGIAGTTIALFLPETCRKVVGNGSLPAPKWNVSLLSYLAIRKQRAAGIEPDSSSCITNKKTPNPLNTIKVILDLESGLVLTYAGLLFAGFYMFITIIPSQFSRIYTFNTLQVGLCYIPSGLGAFASAYFSGRFVDWNFQRHAKKVGLEVSKGKQQDLSNFPIEKARLEIVLPQVVISIALVIGWGWALEKEIALAGVLVILFFLSFFVVSTFQVLSTLVVDLNKNAPGTATAAMNLLRCWLGAAGVAAVVPMVNAMGTGWTMVVVAGLWAAMCPVSLIVMKYGPGWRVTKREKEAAAEQKKENEISQATLRLEEGLSAEKN